ncbi:MAG: tail fiber domain-containing protein, partial [Ginsengibacter sp.]
KRSRGTLSSPSIVQNNDYITSIIASAYDGGTFLSPAAINFYVDGSTSGGSVPARISFETGRNRSTRQERLKILNNGDFDFNDGQLFLEKSTGRIGIGTSALAAKLDILNTDNFYGINVINSFTGNVDREGLSAYSVTNPGYGIGVLATGGYRGVVAHASGSSYNGSVYGIYAYADGSAGSRYGVYGTASGGTFNAAGYFNGDVWAVTYNNLSDRKFKTDIAPLQNALQQLMNLQPKSYLFKKEANVKRTLPSGKQIGLIADEVKQVFPELVKEAVQPAEYGKDRSEVIAPEVKYESVNYIGLIPVLIASIQEQQKSIEDQKKLAAQQQIQIDELKELVKKLSLGKDITNVLTNASLDQNNPNPLDKMTTIRYSLPQNSKSASLLVRDMNGKAIRQVQLGNSLQGNVNFDATGLAAGNYTYSILVDGKLASTKIMTVAK